MSKQSQPIIASNVDAKKCTSSCLNTLGNNNKLMQSCFHRTSREKETESSQALSRIQQYAEQRGITDKLYAAVERIARRLDILAVHLLLEAIIIDEDHQAKTIIANPPDTPRPYSGLHYETTPELPWKIRMLHTSRP